MRRRDVLKKASIAGALALGTTTAASAQTGPSVAEATKLIRLNDRGEKEIINISDMDEETVKKELSPDSHLNCSDDCAVADCTDCPDGCYTECGGCICQS